MQTLEEHIYRLLFTHDCVILPDFGGFVGVYEPATIRHSKQIITPPAKSVTFNKYLVNDDGLLTHNIAGTENISYKEAGEQLKQYIEQLKNQLENKRRVELDKIGVLFLDADNNLKFIAFETNFSLSHFGLPPVKIKTVEKKVEEPKVVPLKIEDTAEKQIPEEEVEKTQEAPVVPIEREAKRKTLWWVAAVAVPLAFYIAWIPMKTDLLNNTSNFHYSDLNPFTFHKVNTYLPRKIKQIEPYRLSAKQVEKIEPLATVKTETPSKTEENSYTAKRETTYIEQKAVKPTSAGKVYHLIGGAFSKQINAENFVTQMQALGYSASIIGKNKGLYRVSLGSYIKRRKAKEAKIKLKNEQDISAWILKK